MPLEKTLAGFVRWAGPGTRASGVAQRAARSAAHAMGVALLLMALLMALLLAAPAPALTRAQGAEPDQAPAPVAPAGRALPSPAPLCPQQWLNPEALTVGPDGLSRFLLQPEFRSARLLHDQLSAVGVPDLKLSLTTPLISAPPSAQGVRGAPEPARLLLSGPLQAVREGLRVLGQLDVPLRSVDVTALVCEVQSTCRQESGGFLRLNHPGPDELPGSQFQAYNQSYEPSSYLIGQLTGARPFEGVSLALASELGEGTFETTLRMLSKRGQAAFIARPHLVCTEGRTAGIEILQDVPFPVIEWDNGNASTSVQSVEVGLRFALHAVTIGEGSAVLEVDLWVRVPEESEDPGSPVGTLLLRQRHVRTRVVLRDEQPIVIGGLFLNRARRSRAGLPGLNHSVQWVDPLMSAREESTSRSELLVYLRGRRIEPQSPSCVRCR